MDSTVETPGEYTLTPDVGAGGPDAANGCGGVEKDLAWALPVAARAFGLLAGPAVLAMPGGPRGFLILATVVRRPRRSQLALAQQLGIDKTAMTYLLDQLETAGLIQRRPDPADRRARQVLVTARGSATLSTVRAALDAAERTLLAPLDGAEASLFRDMLERIATASQTSPDSCPSADPAAPCDLL